MSRGSTELTEFPFHAFLLGAFLGVFGGLAVGIFSLPKKQAHSEDKGAALCSLKRWGNRIIRARMALSDGQSETAREPQEGSARALSRREQIFGTWIFVGVSVLFVALFIIWSQSKYRWVLLALALISLIRGIRHAMAAGKSV
jgi:hypothetical protein